MGKTKKPTGMSIARKDNEFTCSWKIPEKYSKGQQCAYRINVDGKWGHWENGQFITKGDGWAELTCGKTATTKPVTLTMSMYNPSTDRLLSNIEFRVRGKHSKKKGWSAYTTASYEVKLPNRLTVTQELVEGTTNQTTFTWTGTSDDTANEYYTNVYWESILLKDSSVTEGEKAFAEAGVSGQNRTGTSSNISHSTTITETSGLIADGHSYTRWFRVYTRGPRGNTRAVYTKHVYADPPIVTNVRPTASENTSGGVECAISFDATSTATNPTVGYQTQYVMIKPNAGLTCPSTDTWVDGPYYAYKGGADRAKFDTGVTPGEDQCMFIRVNTVNENVRTNGVPSLALIGRLKTPEDLSVTENPLNFKATVTATNKSDVEDSFLVVYFQGDKYPKTAIGIIPHGESSVQVQCPDWTSQTTKAFAVQAVVGTPRSQTKNGITTYTINPLPGKSQVMESDTIWQGGTVPKAPSTVTLSKTEVLGTIQVNWSWTWTDANEAELSWSDHPDAWESTDQPNTFRISNIYDGQWNISGLETGKKWYVRVRLVNRSGGDELYGPYSSIKSINLSSAPNIPSMVLSRSVVPRDGSVTASWGYTTTDGTPQSFAEVCEATITANGITYGRVIAHATSEQSVTIYPAEVNWGNGSTHYLCVRVTSGSGKRSDGWSTPVAVTVATPLTCALTYPVNGSLKYIDIIDDSDEATTRNVLSLTDMPLVLTVTGAGLFGTTTVAIERASSFFLDRPDESEIPRHEGETIALVEQTGETAITIDNNDLIGSFDDGAIYRIVATVSDALGQRAELASPLIFEVHWSEQANEPSGTVVIDNEELVAFITPSADDPGEGDVCDIYRLSSDKPVLIYEGAEWGVTYVDPYPTIGNYGGHRLVYKTANGDYTTSDGEIAWKDFGIEQGDTLNVEETIIDFGNDRIRLKYNIDLSYSWDKDFQETKYLGGAVRGDWNPAVSRTGTVETVSVVETDQETIEAVRRLADYAGICHIRTLDGSSFAADIQVNEKRAYREGHKVASFSLDITRVDPEGYDGQTYEEWSYEEEE